MAKWQSDKDEIVDSMSYHLTRHRPKIQLTNQQSTKRSELSGLQKQGNSLLQQNLHHKYQVRNIEPVRISDDKALFLSEVPTLIADKERADESMRMEASIHQDKCKV